MLTPPKLLRARNAERAQQRFEQRSAFVYRFLAILTKLSLRLHYGRKLGAGWYRTTYQNGGTVYKVGHEYCGGVDCLKEATAHERSVWAGVPIATCEIFWTFAAVPIVVMETVRPATEKDRDNLPDWAGCVDSAQVGQRANGEWVAYDAGLFPNLMRPVVGAIREAAVPKIFTDAA